MTIKYYNNDILETTIIADNQTKSISIENHTDDVIHLAFGVNETPTWADFEHFLEERCVPRTRDNIKEILEMMDVQFYDPIVICQKTQGRMAEDNNWLDFDLDEGR